MGLPKRNGRHVRGTDVWNRIDGGESCQDADANGQCHRQTLHGIVELCPGTCQGTWGAWCALHWTYCQYNTRRSIHGIVLFCL